MGCTSTNIFFNIYFFQNLSFFLSYSLLSASTSTSVWSNVHANYTIVSILGSVWFSLDFCLRVGVRGWRVEAFSCHSLSVEYVTTLCVSPFPDAEWACVDRPHPKTMLKHFPKLNDLAQHDLIQCSGDLTGPMPSFSEVERLQQLIFWPRADGPCRSDDAIPGPNLVQRDIIRKWCEHSPKS